MKETFDPHRAIKLSLAHTQTVATPIGLSSWTGRMEGKGTGVQRFGKNLQ